MRTRLWLATAFLACAAAAADTPQPVSPGALDHLTTTAARCPTLTWTTAAGATAYEIAVYLAEDGEAASAAAGPVLHRRLPTGAGSWTPPVDECLERGVRYAWSVRAETGRGLTGWSLPALFEVAPAPEDLEIGELVRLVLERLQAERGAEGAGRERRARDEVAEVAPRRRARARRPGERVGLEAAPGPAGAGPAHREEAPGLHETAASAPVKLAVDGAVRAQGFAFDEPRGSKLALGATSFQLTNTSEDDEWVVHDDGYGFVSSAPDAVASVDLVAAVPPVPPGAVFGALRCRFMQRENSPTAVYDFELQRRGASSSSAQTVAQADGTTFETGSAMGINTVAFTAEVLDETEYFILARWAPSGVGTDVRFYGCSLSFTVTELSP